MSQSTQSRLNIYFSDKRGEYKFLSNVYPSPFTVGNNRWRTSIHYFQGMKTNDLDRRVYIRDATSATEAIVRGDDITMTIVRPDWEDVDTTSQALNISLKIGIDNITRRDLTMLDAITLKFLLNPELALRLKNTFPRDLIYESDDSYWGVTESRGNNMLGKLLVYLRDNTLPESYGKERDNNDITLTNLLNMLQLQGYTISEPLSVETRGLSIPKADGTTAILDIYISEKYPESRLKQMVDKYKNDDVKPVYIIVGYLDKSNLTKIINRISTYTNIRYYSPSELLVTALNHVQNPPISILTRNDPIYQDDNMKSLPEISVNNKLSKDLGLRRGDIIKVMDFSPHYRICV